MRFPKFNFSKSVIILFFVLFLAASAVGYLYINTKGELNDARSLLSERDNQISELQKKNSELQLEIKRVTEIPTKSVNVTKPVVAKKKKKPVYKSIKNNKRKNSGYIYTSGFKTKSPVVKIVVYDSKGRKNTFYSNSSCNKKKSLKTKNYKKSKKNSYTYSNSYSRR